MHKKILLVLFVSLFVVTVGCTQNEQNSTEYNTEVIKEFRTLVQGDAGLEELADYISDNVQEVSKQDATEMVLEFEVKQRKELPEYEDMFVSDAVQRKLSEEYLAAGDLNIDEANLTDPQVKELLIKTKNSGFKVETAEGMFFPIIDYGFYNKYSTYVNEDIKDYIEIMSIESDKVPAKDAALVVGWDELVERALRQEKFVSHHKDSVKVQEVKQLYKKYFTFIFYGLNNTPLFSYHSNAMDPTAKEAYTSVLNKSNNSPLLSSLEEYMQILKDKNYVLSNEAEVFRDNAVQNLS